MSDHVKTYVFDPPVLDKYILPEPESISLLVEKMRNSISLAKVELDIIRFLAKNGPHSAFDMFKGPTIPREPRKPGRPLTGKREKFPKRDKDKALAYDYKKILRHADKLVQIGLLQSKKQKRKEVLALTFNGFHIYLQDPNRNAEHLDSAIKLNSELLPFAKYWNEIVQIVGKNMARQSLAEAVSQQIYRSPAKIEKINLKFDSFLIKPKPVFPQNEEKKPNKELADFLSTNLELRNSYISYLTVHDIFFITSQKKWSEIDSYLVNLESEKALAFFEKRSIQSNPLFIPGTRLKEFFPEFATVEYFFTGMWMEKLLWKERAV